MNRLAPLVLLFAAAAALAAGCSSQGSGGKPQSGLSVFHTKCSRCHGPDGRGNAVFNTPVLPASQLSEEEMVQVITKGRSKMPSFSLELTPEEIKAVAGYIKHDLGK
jgi:mono/diheme cytochrome c family protein